MTKKGQLILLPNLIGAHSDHKDFLPQSVDLCLETLDGLIAESEKEGRRFLSRFKTNDIPIELFHIIAPDLPLAGRATFEGHIEGPIHQPTGQLKYPVPNQRRIYHPGNPRSGVALHATCPR